MQAFIKVYVCVTLISLEHYFVFFLKDVVLKPGISVHEFEK